MPAEDGGGEAGTLVAALSKGERLPVVGQNVVWPHTRRYLSGLRSEVRGAQGRTVASNPSGPGQRAFDRGAGRVGEKADAGSTRRLALA
jgi:hypothetical protein